MAWIQFGGRDAVVVGERQQLTLGLADADVVGAR